MKTILIIIAMTFTVSSWARNYVPKSKIKAPSVVYMQKSKCEQVEGEKCFSITGKDVRRFQAGFRSIDIEFTRDCNDSADCQFQIDESNFTCDAGAGEVPSFDDKANWPALDFASEVPPRPATGWFLWCQKEILVADSAGSSAADAADAAKAADDATRASKQSERLTNKDACVAAVNGGGNLTNVEIKDCINVLVKEVYKSQIAPGDL